MYSHKIPTRKHSMGLRGIRLSRLGRGLNLVITILLLLAFLLTLWNSRPCPALVTQAAIARQSPGVKVVVNMNGLPVSPDQVRSSHYTEEDDMSESDIMSNKPSPVNLEEYRKLLKWKISDLKRNGVLRHFPPRNACRADEPDKVCIDKNCGAKLPDTHSDENLRSVLKPLTRLKERAISKTVKLLGDLPTGHNVTFITAGSSDHFLESQALIKNLHLTVFPRLHNYTFIYYDIGLEEDEREQLQRLCMCEVRKYPFEKLPTRLRFIRGFTWKPIIINAHLPTTDYIVWVDSSVRFRTGQLTPMFEDARARGLAFSPVGKYALAEHTSKDMFQYFSDSACHFSQYNEAEAGFQILHNDPFIRNFLVKVWTACALDPLCMATDQSEPQFHCNNKIRQYSKCHRFDQSAYSLILAKLFRQNIMSFYIPKGKYHILRRHQTDNYFDKLESEVVGKLQLH
ncbi:uncharacterized protein LOC124273154 isoform X1 [Haliotis rubra]|uniref:uncharacterized protein LOC124273154 isoform X1 n=2 Tax=Haliotis rubra TaxID=36100 RepID=UPI001EE5BF60|nr:uncharacterized protein LOC124273154 isoform X1 [Haliotis rubra]